MRNPIAWLERRIENSIDRIDHDESKPDDSFPIPSWRRWELRHASAETLSRLVAETELAGYELRGGETIADITRVFVEPTTTAGA